MIRDAALEDASAIAKIYNYYVDQTAVTFEVDSVDSNEIQRRIQNTLANGHPWLVQLDSKGQVVGYAYAGHWRDRVASRATFESAIYVSHDHTRQGFGRALYETLLDRLQEAGNVHVVIGVIAVPNDASVGLHQKLGFKEVGLYREVGRKFDRWIDVLSLQLKMSDWRGGE